MEVKAPPVMNECDNKIICRRGANPDAEKASIVCGRIGVGAWRFGVLVSKSKVWNPGPTGDSFCEGCYTYARASDGGGPRGFVGEDPGGDSREKDRGCVVNIRSLVRTLEIAGVSHI